MKLLIAIGLLVNAALLAAVLLDGNVVAVNAAAGGAVPVGNGDVNSDGKIDVSDAIYLLSSLFLGGPAPKPIQCPPPPAGGSLPATGQTVCSDADGQAIDCASAEFPGQDGFYRAGCPKEGRFQDNGDGTVTDHCTGLLWQKETAPGTFSWQEALKYCKDLTLGGHSDWRLPNVRELGTIVDHGRYDPAIDPVFGVVSDWYWSSSSSVLYPRFAWFVNFRDGHNLADDSKLRPHYVRAVRQGP